MSRWFRFYDDALNDPKIIRLPDDLYRSWIGILCIASKCNGNLPCVEDVAIMLRQSVSSSQNILSRLEELTLLDRSRSGVLSPHNWLKRQYKSDVSTDRVRAFRKRERNVSVTPPDTDQITDTEQIDDDEAPSAVASKTGSITQEAIDLTDRITKRLGFSVKDPPPSWCGSAFKVQSWLSGGWQPDAIFASIDRQMAGRNGHPPPNVIQYFEKGIADFIATQNAPLPQGTSNGFRGPYSLQDDSRSAGKAAGRLAAAAERGEFKFAPLPSLLPGENEDNVRLLPKG